MDYDKRYAVMADTPSIFRSAFASLSLHRTDRLRLLCFPPNVTVAVRSAIAAGWPRGIQEERNYDGSVEFKLSGNPWTGSGNDSAHSKRMMMRVLEALAELGWMLTLATDISKKPSDKDTLLFRHQNPAPAPLEWTCVSFSRQDRLRFIDAPQELGRDMIEALRGQTQSHGTYDRNVYELKIRGNPWCASGTETMDTRRLLLVLLQVFEVYGFTVYASIDQKTTQDAERGDTDAWFCCRPRGWQSGMPVFHA